jgi:hypothetical protein
MHASNSVSVSIEADNIVFPFESPTNEELDNRIVSPCGRFESFDYKGNHFEIDLNEIAPPGDTEEEDEREGVPHEQYMKELDQYIAELVARRRVVGR